jgi:hypothetical protein
MAQMPLSDSSLFPNDNLAQCVLDKISTAGGHDPGRINAQYVARTLLESEGRVFNRNEHPDDLGKAIRAVLLGILISRKRLEDIFRAACAYLRWTYIPASLPATAPRISGGSLDGPQPIGFARWEDQLKTRGILRVGVLEEPWLLHKDTIIHHQTHAYLRIHLANTLGLNGYRIVQSHREPAKLIEQLTSRYSVDTVLGAAYTAIGVGYSKVVSHHAFCADPILFLMNAKAPLFPSAESVVRPPSQFMVVKGSNEELLARALLPGRVALRSFNDHTALFNHLEEDRTSVGLVGEQRWTIESARRALNGRIRNALVAPNQCFAMMWYNDIWHRDRFPTALMTALSKAE